MGNKLNARSVATISEPGKYGDGNGLMLVVSAKGAKSWLQRLTAHGRRQDIGLGVYPEISLADARRLAEDNRRIAAQGGDPLAAKREAAAKAREEALAGMTWADACERVHALNEGSWKNPKHSQQFINTLRTYTPKMAKTAMKDVTQQQILQALSEIWLTKPETARRVFQRIQKVLMWARAEGAYRGSPRDAMDAVRAALPSQKKVAKVRHHPAMPYAEVPEFLEVLRACGARPTTKLALEFIILCAARSGEVRLARWSEVDLDARTWTIPAERMKMDREHVVPLTDRACEVLQDAKIYTDGSDLIFPGMKKSHPMSDMTPRKLMRDLGSEYVPHGFRSSFRDWCNEVARAPSEVAEMCLAHQVGNAVERAYSRSDLLERRRELMAVWAGYVEPDQPSNVVALSA